MQVSSKRSVIFSQQNISEKDTNEELCFYLVLGCYFELICFKKLTHLQVFVNTFLARE